jgi:hypothetical protein
MDLLGEVSGGAVVHEVEAAGEVVMWHPLRRWMLLSPMHLLVALEVW